MHFIVRLIVLAFTLVLVANFIPGIEITGAYPAIIAALILGLLNAIVRPVLFILTLPITIVTLGLFVFVLNASIFLFVASFVEGFEVEGFLPALVGSVLVSLISGVVNKIT